MKKISLFKLASAIVMAYIIVNSARLLAVQSRPESFVIAREFQQPSRSGVHVIDLKTGKVSFISDFYEWALSPNGEYVMGGKDELMGNYDVYLVSLKQGSRHHTSSRKATALEKRAFLQSLQSKNTKRGMISPNRQYRSSTLEENGHIIVIKRTQDNRETRRIDVGRPCHIQAWSPDSHKVLFVTIGKFYKYPDQKDKLYTLDVTTGHIITVLNTFDAIDDASYSPNGQWIVAECANGFYQKPDFKGGIFLFRPDGSHLTQVTHNVQIQKKDADDREVQWLPNGTGIIFRRTSYEDEGI